MGEVAEVRAALGGQLETEGHGILDLGWRRGGTSIQWFTDTADLRLERRFDRGRAEVGLRVASFAAGMWISPWSHGAPDPDRAQLSGYAGADARREWWGPHGTWAAADGFARYVWFVPLPDTVIEESPTPWAHVGASIGRWSPEQSVRLGVGLDARPERLSPSLTFEAKLAPQWWVAPFAEVRAGWADGADDLFATRLGGMTPYHVPLAGAAWAEFWVEDYAATRAGLRVKLGPIAPAAAVDAAVWTFPDLTALPDPPERQGAVGLAGGLGADLDPVWVGPAAAWLIDAD
ncbi:MAG: hypothetical protein ABMA64_18850, partial [Myxococcota bacterium]